MITGADVRPEGNGKSEFNIKLARMIDERECNEMSDEIHSQGIPSRFNEDPLFRMLTERSEDYQRGIIDGVKLAQILKRGIFQVRCLSCGGNEFAFLMKTWKERAGSREIMVKCRNCGKVRLELM